MNRVRKQIGVPTVWEAKKGKNARSIVAVLDTGISIHPDLQGSVLAFRDFINDRKEPYDDNGHGTHVCGIIAGSGRMSVGKYAGIAPHTQLVVGKILNGEGEGMATDLIAGLKWILELKRQYPITLINISIGIGEIKDRKNYQAVKILIREAWDQGILLICAAGNTGPEPGSMSSLSMMNEIISVGCHDGGYPFPGSGSCEAYSACGKLHTKKPDLVAPGTAILSCNHDYQITINGNLSKGISPYIRKSGTSMATAIVTGSMVLYLDKYGLQSPKELKKALLSSCRDLKEPYYKQGWGMLNVSGLLEL